MSDPTGFTARPVPAHPAAAARPTDLANAAAVAAQRERRGLPPDSGPRAPRPRGRGVLMWLLVVALAAVVVFGGSTAWAYFSGTIGPLRGDQRQAADALAGADDAPRWARKGQMRCAAEHLVRTQGLPAIAAAGVLTGDEGRYSYSGRWPSALAVRWYQAMLGCAGTGPSAWGSQVASAWSLGDGKCLDDLGSSRISGVLAANGVAVTDDALAGRNKATIDRLDTCYAHQPAAPMATATPGYREVGLVVTRPAVADGTPLLQVTGADPTKETSASQIFRLPVARGGAQACVSARTQVTYAWGTVRVGAPTRLCGRAEPATLAWDKVAQPCRKGVKKCAYEALSVEGLASKQRATVTYTMSGDFLCPNRKRTCKVKVTADATGRTRAPMIDVTGKRTGHIVARIGTLKATFPTG